MATSTPTYNPQASYGYFGGPFGSQPAPVPIPQPAQDLANQIPGLSGLNSSASNFIGSELSGQLSPDTLQAIQRAGAQQSVSSGMPNTGMAAGTLAGQGSLATIGQTSQQLQNQGVSDYSKFVPTVSSTQTVNPAVEAEINTQNSINAAAPNPGAAATYAQQLFQQYLSQLNKPAQTQASKLGLSDNATYYTPAGSSKFIRGIDTTSYG